MNAHITVMAEKVDLGGSWDTFWDAVSGPAGPILSLMGIIGVAIVVLAFGKWAWDRRRQGGGGNTGGLWGALLIGVLLSAPSIIIPMVLSIFDIIANAGITVFNKGSKG